MRRPSAGWTPPSGSRRSYRGRRKERSLLWTGVHAGWMGTRPLTGADKMIGSTAMRPQRNFFCDPPRAAQFFSACDACMLKNNEARRILANDPQSYPQAVVDIVVTIRSCLRNSLKTKSYFG